MHIYRFLQGKTRVWLDRRAEKAMACGVKPGFHHICGFKCGQAVENRLKVLIEQALVVAALKMGNEIMMGMQVKRPSRQMAMGCALFQDARHGHRCD